MNRFKLLFFFLLFPTLSFGGEGGTTIGDGGQGVMCDGAHLLEFYEARKLYGFQPNFEAQSYNTILRNIKVAVKLARKRFHEAYGLDAEVEKGFNFALHIASLVDSGRAYFSQRTLDLINDFGTVGIQLPKKCFVFQAAEFRVRKQLKPKIEFYEPAFDQLSNDDISGLILHEAFHVLFTREKNNMALRQFILYLSAPAEFRKKNEKLFRQLYKEKLYLVNGFYGQK